MHLGPGFCSPTGNASAAGGGTIFTAGIVLAVMILPIITAVTREVFVQTPQDEIEAALALGATRWEVVKTTVLPFGRSGFVSGAILGLGRALGETVALLIILRGTQTAFGWSLFDGGSTFATKIAAAAPEFDNQYKAGAYIAAGLVLFLLTFVVNGVARAAVAGTRAGRSRFMTSMLDRPLKWRTLAGRGRRRRIANTVATISGDAGDGDRPGPLALVAVFGGDQRIQALTSSAWWTHSQAGTTAFEPGGGAYHAIIGTLLLGLACAAISIPVGVLVGIYLVEYGGRSPLARLVTFTVDILAGVPSIVAALFIYAVWVVAMGLPRSQFAVALALVLMMLPVIARATEEMLRIVPMDLREASYALGIPKWKTIVRVVLPTGLSGILTGILLALARVLGETSPLLILVGYAHAMNFDMFSGFMGSLPGMMYDQTTVGAGANPVPTDRLWGAALTLILLIAIINIGARVVAKIFTPKKT